MGTANLGKRLRLSKVARRLGEVRRSWRFGEVGTSAEQPPLTFSNLHNLP